MKSNFALRTFVLLATWLIFENFNLSTVHAAPFSAQDARCCAHDLPHAMPGSIHSAADHWLQGCKSMESAVHQAPSSLFQLLSLAAPPYKIKTIVLDAGHGGKDPGCIGASAYEKENSLAIVLLLGAYFKANYPEIKVVYTRDADYFVELNERAAIANRNKADLFISVHCNAISTKSTHGAETYVLGLHRSKDNLDVAKRENASIYLEKDYQKNYEGYDPESPEAEIFASVWQSAYLEQSILLASYVQQFSSAVAFRYDRGVKQAGFLVLRETAMPSVLIEAGFLTNATEEEFLASDEGREQMALAIFQSFEAYKRHVETGRPIENLAALPLPVRPTATHVPIPPRLFPPKAQTLPAEPKNEPPLPAVTVAQKTNPTATKVPATTVKKQTTAATNPKAATPKLPEVANFTIFLLAWPHRLDPNVGQLSLLVNVKELNKDGKFHYYAGDYRNKADAEKVLPEIQNMGFKSAIIVQN